MTDETGDQATATAEPVEPTEPGSPAPRRRRRALIAGGVVVALIGVTLAGAAVYVNSVDVPELLTLPETTTLYYNDGQTVLAELGDVRRQSLAYDELSEVVRQAAVAARDPDFWTSAASPITRDVIRIGADLGDSSGYSVTARSAVLAWKLEDTWSKEQILTYYLNALNYGRGMYGIEAAAGSYFGKSANSSTRPRQQLTTSEAILLAALVAQPNPTPESPGFDPTTGAAAAANAEKRWAEIRDQMVELGYLTRAAADALSFPTVVPAQRSVGPGYGRTAPAGLVANQVLSELTFAEGSPFKGWSWQQIEAGGYRIVTTVDHRAQHELVNAADKTVEGSVMHGLKDNLQAAGVMIEPGTGRVVAYYGNESGTGGDYAGIYRQADGAWTGYGAHPPGSGFQPHTLAAALIAGVSLKSYWRWDAFDQPGRVGENQVRSSSMCVDVPRQPQTTPCTLLGAKTQSLNVPFYTLTLSITPAKVLEAARGAGIDFMWTDSHQRVDLVGSDLAQLVPSRFGADLGLGQYAVTVLDQANAMATYGAGGRRASAHFVRSVSRGSQVMYAETLPADGQPRVLTPEASADLNYALSRNPTATTLGPGYAGSTGAWSGLKRTDQNTDVWMCGYTDKLALAVWIGNAKQQQALIGRAGPMWGSAEPSRIFARVMTGAHEALRLNPTPFAPPVFAGALDPPGSVPAPPS